MAQGSLTVRQLVSMYLARIERLNPTLKAFVSVRPDAALEGSNSAQKLLAQSEQRPLLGLPFAVKDEHDVAGELTSFGTGACSTVADSDDEIVHLLRSRRAPSRSVRPRCPSWACTHSPNHRRGVSLAIPGSCHERRGAPAAGVPLPSRLASPRLRRPAMVGDPLAIPRVVLQSVWPESAAKPVRCGVHR